MLAAGVTPPTIKAFLNAVHRVIAGERGMVAEKELESISVLPQLEDISDASTISGALCRTPSMKTVGVPRT